MGLLPDTWTCGLPVRRKYQEGFPRHRGLAIPTRITARAWRTCRDAYRDCNPAVSFWVSDGGKDPCIAVACATRNFTYLARGLGYVFQSMMSLWLPRGSNTILSQARKYWRHWMKVSRYSIKGGRYHIMTWGHVSVHWFGLLCILDNQEQHYWHTVLTLYMLSCFQEMYVNTFTLLFVRRHFKSNIVTENCKDLLILLLLSWLLVTCWHKPRHR